MVLGRRYLAPIVRHNGTWYPFFPTRLRLRGHLVVGGVDGGEAENSHQALVGRSVRSAVRLIADTRPYRAVVLHPEGNPARRWNAVDSNDYRIWRDPGGLPVIVASGVTSRSRWQLYLRRPKRGGMCVGMSARPLWRPEPAPSRSSMCACVSTARSGRRSTPFRLRSLPAGATASGWRLRRGTARLSPSRGSTATGSWLRRSDSTTRPARAADAARCGARIAPRRPRDRASGGARRGSSSGGGATGGSRPGGAGRRSSAGHSRS